MTRQRTGMFKYSRIYFILNAIFKIVYITDRGQGQKNINILWSDNGCVSITFEIGHQSLIFMDDI